jgi:bisphosphoglycerate-dependent phosphoglycerate mutase
VTGLRSEAAFHLTNGAHDDDDVSNWKDLNNTDKQETALWANSKLQWGNIQVKCEFKLNTSNATPKVMVSDRQYSGSEKKWIQALERYIRSTEYRKLPQHFKNIMYGTGNGALDTSADVVNNLGTVHKLYTRHAFSCANAAKTIGAFRFEKNRILDVIILPVIIRRIGMGILKAFTFLDTKLTDLGVWNSKFGGYKLAEECVAAGIPAPTKVFTSTMQRTLETARYMMMGMTQHAANNPGAALGWGGFDVANIAMTIMPGIKEQGAGAENSPQNTYNALRDRLNADNNGVWAVNDDTVDTTWITGYGSTWAQNKDTDSFSYFQDKLGMSLRADMGNYQANGANNVAVQTNFITTHSRQMKSWFAAFAGGEKPENNETWHFEYVRVPGLYQDSFVLVSAVPEPQNAAPALWRVGNYGGFRQRKAKAMDVAPSLANHGNAVVQHHVNVNMCHRCGNNFLAWYAKVGM